MSEELKRWQEIAKHATSGDQVCDILMAWKKSEDELQSALIQAQGAIQYQGMEINTLRKQLDIAVEALKEVVLGKAGINLSANSIRRYDIEIAEDALAEIEKEGKGAS